VSGEMTAPGDVKSLSRRAVGVRGPPKTFGIADCLE